MIIVCLFGIYFLALSKAKDTYLAFLDNFLVTNPGIASQSCIIYGVLVILHAKIIGAET